MSALIDKLKVEDEKLNIELEELHGDFDKMKLVFEKKIDFYHRFLKEDNLSEMDKLTLTNKKEWTMSHLLNLIIEKELRDRIRELNKRLYRLEQTVELDERP